MFLFAFTFFALCECLWPSHPGRSYSEHVWRLVFKAIFSAVGRWSKSRRVSSTSSTRPAGPVYDLSQMREKGLQVKTISRTAIAFVALLMCYVISRAAGPEFSLQVLHEFEAGHPRGVVRGGDDAFY